MPHPTNVLLLPRENRSRHPRKHASPWQPRVPALWLSLGDFEAVVEMGSFTPDVVGVVLPTHPAGSLCIIAGPLVSSSLPGSVPWAGCASLAMQPQRGHFSRRVLVTSICAGHTRAPFRVTNVWAWSHGSFQSSVCLELPAQLIAH